ncbi:MAG: hypothetical protein CM1200mP41_36340 [Gammaproteobacteria bacterium]|nr:MAG: hypothetical protein CM1200mP41_36340 [Gammaproteobacteria bacterium]
MSRSNQTQPALLMYHPRYSTSLFLIDLHQDMDPTTCSPLEELSPSPFTVAGFKRGDRDVG